MSPYLRKGVDCSAEKWRLLLWVWWWTRVFSHWVLKKNGNKRLETGTTQQFILFCRFIKKSPPGVCTFAPGPPKCGGRSLSTACAAVVQRVLCFCVPLWNRGNDLLFLLDSIEAEWVSITSPAAHSLSFSLPLSLSFTFLSSSFEENNARAVSLL